MTARADEILRDIDIFHNPYFENLRCGGMPLEWFRRTQEQFFFAVTFFPRPMAALVGRIPDPKARIDILHNLVEEHGDFKEEFYHHTTFLKFLNTIGSSVTNFEPVAAWPAIRAFNSVLTCACVIDELEVGVGCMGIIEHAFAGIASIIGQAVVQNGWVRKADLIHYTLHAEIDCRHAAEFFTVVERQWDMPARRYYIDQGLQLGAYIFDRLYRDLYLTARRQAQA
jgi:pyrroloquinoline-quinone synthase